MTLAPQPRQVQLPLTRFIVWQCPVKMICPLPILMFTKEKAHYALSKFKLRSQIHVAAIMVISLE
jgi:hypothetical protein